MINPVSESGTIVPGVSPIAGSSKHCMTPLRARRKTSRKDQSADVHTTCSTPNRLHATKNLPSSWNSPNDSIPCSQEHRPDVIWDYTSPKLPKGAKKREIKITVEEFLNNLNQNQAPECNTQNSHYIKLLEKWMTKQNTPVCVKKPVRVMKRDHKMRSRRVFEEIKQFMESIQKIDGTESKEQNKKEDASENILPCASENKKSLLNSDDINENDSLEELWGEADNSFIVKATQHLDVSCLKYDAQSKNKDTVPGIVNTSNTSTETKNKNCNSMDSFETNSLNKAVIDSDQQAQILLTQIMNCDWESDSDFEDFENGFIMGDDDALSLIPEEILSGVTKGHDDNSTEKTSQHAAKMSSSSASSDKMFESKNGSCEISFGSSASNKITSNIRTENISEIELFNNFDESFGDESILCQPEVLSMIDEVESKLSQSQKLSSEFSEAPKCSPEEIKKKKDEAVQRRKKNMSRNRK